MTSLPTEQPVVAQRTNRFYTNANGDVLRIAGKELFCVCGRPSTEEDVTRCELHIDHPDLSGVWRACHVQLSHQTKERKANNAAVTRYNRRTFQVPRSDDRVRERVAPTHKQLAAAERSAATIKRYLGVEIVCASDNTFIP